MEMILALRDYVIDEPQPESPVDAAKWTKAQRHMLAIIHLNCYAKQAHLFRSAKTGSQAWTILSQRFASTSAPNVMRLEESFGTDRQNPSQSMSDWIAYMEGLSEELIAVGCDVSDVRLANHILVGLAIQHDAIKQALHARDSGPKLDVIKEHLLSYELDHPFPKSPLPNVPTPYSVPRPYTYNNTHQGPIATAMPTHIPGPVPSSASGQNYRYNPYATARPSSSLSCHAYGKVGHTQNCCRIRFPHLKPQ